MYASWACAFRSAALNAPRIHVATRNQRFFRTSSAVNAATGHDDPSHGPPNEGQGGDSKPENDEYGKVTESKDPEESVSGDNGNGSSNGNGESQGRRSRRLNAPLRSRTLKSRTPEELPSFSLPKEFVDCNIHRLGSFRETPFENVTESSEASTEEIPILAPWRIFGGPMDTEAKRKMSDISSGIIKAAIFTDSEVQMLKETIGSRHVKTVLQRGDAVLTAAASYIACKLPLLAEDLPNKSELVDEFTRFVQLHHKESSLSWDRFAEIVTLHPDPPIDSRESERRILDLRDILHSSIALQPSLGQLHYDLLHEAVTSIRADFAVNPPKNFKTSEFKRPITILNVPYYSGFAWPKCILQDIAAEAEADVVHLAAQDVARLIGAYLGQDIIRAPGPLSLLGYKAAENAGRITREKVDQAEQGLSQNMPFLVMQEMKPKKESKKKLTIMDHVFGEPSRGKSDDMWEDMKINAALEEFVHAADADPSSRRPVIIHLHDINALSMDEDGGALILSKLRKIIDNLWSEGKRIVLVGSCSSLDAPSPYLSSLKEFETADRVITLHTLPEDSHDNVGFKKIQSLQKIEYIDENAHNIGTMLEMLLDPNREDSSSQISFNLHALEANKALPKAYSERVLPLSEVYRIAKTMIGLRRHQSDAVDQAVLERAVRLTKRVDDAKGTIAKSHERLEGDLRRNLMEGMLGEKHEDKFTSALIDPKDIKTTFKDVHAPRETIDSVKMLTQLSLLRPEAFAYGVLATDRIPGCLLYGPPGTGKTLLAKAVAKESGANMIEISGASINDMYFGESEKNIRALFQLAKKKEPLVIFIDEADAMLGARGRGSETNGRRDVINQFLREWDGMDAMKAFIMVATNRPFDLDEAVLRRLPRKLLVDLPMEPDRAAILRIHLKGEALDDTVAIEQIAKQTPLYSGSDLKNVCVAAAMAAVKEEMDASERHTGPDPYIWAEKRVLNRRHFDKAVAEIPASVSEDMATLTAIKKFDERYGERKSKRKRRGMGFEVVPEATDSERARVRNPDA